MLIEIKGGVMMAIEDKDIGLKIASKEEAMWTEVKEQTLKEIERLEKMLIFNQAILGMSIQKIESLITI